MSDEVGEFCTACGEGWWAEGNWMLLCDGLGCERAYHTKCLRPALDAVPEGDWLCPACAPQAPELPPAPMGKKPKAPKAPKKSKEPKEPKAPNESGASKHTAGGGGGCSAKREKGDDADDDMLRAGTPDAEEGRDAICTACGEGWWAEGNWMLLCDGLGCERAYHTKCLRPALDAVPEGEWLCPTCARSANEDDDSACQVCAQTWWAEGNQMLLCDGAGCERAYHTKCLVPALDAVPQGEWLCPSCICKMAAAPATSPVIAPCLRAIAWSTAWHFAHERATNMEGAKVARKALFAATTTLGTLLVDEIVEACVGLCWETAAKRMATTTTSSERCGSSTDADQGPAAVVKAKRVFDAHAATLAHRLPAALVTTLVELAAAATEHAAATATQGGDEAGAVVGTGSSVAASSFAALEHAERCLGRLDDTWPPLWRGTPLPTAPLAEALKWLSWNSAWQMANELSGLRADARRALASVEEHRAKLLAALPGELVEVCHRLCSEAAARASHERLGQADAAEYARKAFEVHAAALARRLPAALASAIVELAVSASWHAANSQRGFKDDAAEDLKLFEKHARALIKLSEVLPVAPPRVGSSEPERRRRRLRSRRQQRQQAARPLSVPLSAAGKRALKRAVKRRLMMRHNRLVREALYAALPEAARVVWDGCPFPVLLAPSRLRHGTAAGAVARTAPAATADADASTTDTIPDTSPITTPDWVRTAMAALFGRQTAASSGGGGGQLGLPPSHPLASATLLGIPSSGAIGISSLGAVACTAGDEDGDGEADCGEGDDDEGDGTGSAAAGGGERRRGGGGGRELFVGARVEAQYGIADDEEWWPGTITQLWTNGDVDVQYDDGDFEAQKPRRRVRPCRGAAAASTATHTLMHPRHSHVAFVGARPRGDAADDADRSQPLSARFALCGVRLAMVEEGLFADSSTGGLIKSSVHVHWLQPLAEAGDHADVDGSLTLGLRFDRSRLTSLKGLLCAVHLSHGGWDERGGPLFTLEGAEAVRVAARAREAARAAAEEEARFEAERAAADLERRQRQAIVIDWHTGKPLAESLPEGKRRRSASATDRAFE